MGEMELGERLLSILPNVGDFTGAIATMALLSKLSSRSTLCNGF